MNFNAVDDLIERRRLHLGGVPVSLDCLEDEYPMMLLELAGSGIAGIAIPPSDGGPARPDHPAMIGIDCDLDDERRELVYAHEVGHVLCGHLGTLMVSEINAAWHEKQEGQAWAAAAMLKVPTAMCLSGETVEEIAARCHVPAGLVERHPALQHVRTGRGLW